MTATTIIGVVDAAAIRIVSSIIMKWAFFRAENVEDGLADDGEAAIVSGT